MTPPETFEASIAQALIDADGPPELAPQLVALARQHGITPMLTTWIRFHIGGMQWSAMQFDQWAIKYNETRKALALENFDLIWDQLQVACRQPGTVADYLAGAIDITQERRLIEETEDSDG
jgi:hypothetical protein